MMKLEYPIIDIHSHILPGIDDGARTMKETLDLLEMAYEQGIRAIIATPHCFRHRKNEDPEKLLEEVRLRIREELPERFPDLELYAGHETFYHEALPEKLLSGEARSLAGSRYVLVEFDPGASAGGIVRGIRRIFDCGYQPVLAHVERYGSLREKRAFGELLGSGCLLQMNYDSLAGSGFSSEVRWCRRQVSEGNISFLATDMHRPVFRPPKIGEPLAWLKKHLGEEEIRALLYENARRILPIPKGGA